MMGSTSTTTDTDIPTELLPVRVLNEYAYCPGLFHLMHGQGCWADNVYTQEGRNVHWFCGPTTGITLRNAFARAGWTNS